MGTVTSVSAATPSRLVASAVRGRVAARVPSRRPSRRRRALLERVPRAGGRLSRSRRRVGAGSRPDACRRVPRELGARAGQSLASRATIRAPARRRGSRASGSRRAGSSRTRRVARTSPSGVNAAGYRYATFGENLFAGTWGTGLATRRRERMAAVTSAPGERPQRPVPARRSRPGSRERSARRHGRRRVDGNVRLASLALEDSARPTGNLRPCARRASSTTCAPRSAATSSGWPSAEASRS